LKVACIIGTLPRERRKKQPVMIDLAFPADIRKAARRDDLRDAINYKKLAEHISDFVSQSRFYLIETLAERLAKRLLADFPLRKITLRISKPNALPAAKNVSIQITRTR